MKVVVQLVRVLVVVLVVLILVIWVVQTVAYSSVNDRELMACAIRNGERDGSAASRGTSVVTVRVGGCIAAASAFD